ncbi:MAG: HAD family hydrolase [Myxococcota bacterium]
MSSVSLPRPPAAVTFDCWNTLLFEPDWPVAHAHRVDALVRTVSLGGRAITRQQAGAAFDRAWSRHMDAWRAGRATGAREVARDALSLLGHETGDEELAHLVREYENASHSGGVRSIEGAREALSRLRAAGVRCALICDTGLTPGRVVRLHLAHHGLLEHLEVQVFSDEQGVPKPDPRVFHAALDPLEARPERSVHIGDLRRTDVAGARSVGMASLRIRARHDDGSDLSDADAVVDSYEQVLSLLLGPGA